MFPHKMENNVQEVREQEKHKTPFSLCVYGNICSYVMGHVYYDWVLKNVLY